MITAKINLAALKHGLIKGKTEGEVMICIPIKANDLFQSEKGNVYLDIIGFEFEDKSDKQYKDTHLLKQSLPKAIREKMTDEEKKAMPILGNASVSGSGQRSESAPNSATPGEVAEGVGDLPF